jgi:phage terminase small subunit
MKHHVHTRLTPKRETFAQLVARGESASGAYRKAYGQGRKTNKTLHEAASRLSRNSKVVARVAALRAPALLQAQYTITVDLNRTLFENARVGFSDIRKLFGPGGRLLDPHEWDDDTAAAVASVEHVALFGKGKDGLGQIGYTTKVTLWNKGDALDRLMRNLGGYKRDNNPKKDLLADLPFETLQMMERQLSALVERPAVVLGAPARGAKRPARPRPHKDPA